MISDPRVRDAYRLLPRHRGPRGLVVPARPHHHRGWGETVTASRDLHRLTVTTKASRGRAPQNVRFHQPQLQGARFYREKTAGDLERAVAGWEKAGAPSAAVEKNSAATRLLVVTSSAPRSAVSPNLDASHSVAPTVAVATR